MASASLQDPKTWHADLRSAQLNGITQRWADTATNPEEAQRPAVLLMHGWPESWYSWRHQLKALDKAGYRAIAPDMRGYGGTSAPVDVAEYNVYTLAADMLALLQHLGISRVALVGHDHGANLGWKLALLHPNVFVCYVAMSVPYGGRSSGPPIETYRKMFGDERQPETDPNFFYMLHHQLPNAAADYAQDVPAMFKVLYGDMNGADAAPVTSGKLFVNGKSEPMWRRAPQPKALHSWISQPELDYFVQEFQRGGWDGGLNWYRVMDIDWLCTPQLKDRRVETPCAFVAGSKDMVINMFGGAENVEAALAKVCKARPVVKFLSGAGHWIQQERPQEVNTFLLDFLKTHRSSFEAASSAGPHASPQSRL
eukprot:TRINITY_DN71544_c0_g1_i1.p1 TRINITY_DN71544_c0_g1~~TRINITY_DN71544_c0_g1_i1.p1  ORF type:complete len:379 (-),score=70.10 TRINITY_DN71544_c0_g1_i1:35-1138(-)